MQIPLDAKAYIPCNVSRRALYENSIRPPEHEKLFIDISRPGHIGIHYVTRISQGEQKHKFSVMCPGALFMETTLGPLDHEKQRP
jgi:hypothetical protein